MMQRSHRRPALGRAVSATALAWCLLAGGGAALAATAPPATTSAAADAQLVGTVRQALERGDLATLEGLVDWTGATPMGRRLAIYEMRYGFGRPIRSIALEAFPQDGFSALQARGTLVPNMPVTQRLRVVFDEPDDVAGHAPGVIFLIGRQQEAYRIALIVPVKGAAAASGR